MAHVSENMKYVILFIMLSVVASLLLFIPGWLFPP